MAQRSKGLRKQIRMSQSMPVHVQQVIANRAAAAGTSASQYMADLLAFAVGRADLARALTQTAIDYPDHLLADVEPPANMNPRVDLAVYQLINEVCVKRGDAGAYLLDVCVAHVNGERLPALPKAEEGLLLTG